MIRPHELEEYLPGPRSAPRRPEGGPYLCGYAYGRQDAPSGARRDGPLGRVGRARGGRGECGDGRRPPGAGGGVRTPRRCGGRARRDVPSRSPPLRGERPQSGPLVPWASGLPRPVGAPGEGAPAGPLADKTLLLPDSTGHGCAPITSAPPPVTPPRQPGQQLPEQGNPRRKATGLRAPSPSATPGAVERALNHHWAPPRPRHAQRPARRPTPGAARPRSASVR